MVDSRRYSPVRWYPSASASAVNAPTGPTLLWLHGGGFFRGSPDLPEAHEVASSLAKLGLTVATTGYRLAPAPGIAWVKPHDRPGRGRFPSALDDVIAAYREVSEASPAGVILGGASAGACLAAATVLRALADGLHPRGAVFAYGFFHARHPRTRDRRHQSDRHRRLTHAPWALNMANRNYAGSEEALVSRFAFPGGHELAGFPRTLLINAEHDNMRESGDVFAAELGATGADVQHHVLPGTRHAFLNRPRLRAFSTAISIIAAWSTPGGDPPTDAELIANGR
jgi:acetyl esterase